MNNRKRNLRLKLRNQAKYYKSNLPENLGYVGNMGLAKVNIKGVPRLILAHSRIDKRNSYGGVSKKFALLRKPRIFNTKNVPNNEGGKPYNRKYDTESKILEDIAARIGYNRTIRGNIVLYTEKKPCLSCLGVMKEFRKRYPGITLSVYYG